MPTLAAVIYVSNQAIGRYPLEYVAGTLGFADTILLYGGTPADFEWLTALKARHPLGAKMSVHLADFVIDDMPHISGMMERAYNLARQHADYVLLVQADECATPESVELVHEFMARPESYTQAAHMYCRTSFLYHDFLTGWGHTIAGSGWGGTFVKDGFGENSDGSRLGHIGGWSSSDPDIEVRLRSTLRGTLEIGSLSPELYYWHQRQNVRVWNEYNYVGAYLSYYPGARGEDPKLPQLPQGTQASRENFILKVLHLGRWRIARRPLIPIETIDPRFTKVIDDMGLRDDCTYVCRLVREHGFGPPGVVERIGVLK